MVPSGPAGPSAPTSPCDPDCKLHDPLIPTNPSIPYLPRDADTTRTVDWVALA